MRLMSDWSNMETWQGNGLRREVFFFPSQGVRLFGSVYATTAPAPPLGVLICNSWGYEGNLASRLVHPISIAMARAGGVAVNFHYPGFGDSEGEWEAITMEAMASAAVDALGEASRRYPDTRWIIAGLMLGASVACLALGAGASVGQLLLVQPALRPGRYLARLARVSKRSLEGPAPEPAPGFAFGYPLSQAVLDSAAPSDNAVAAALASFDGEGAIVRYAKPAATPSVPPNFEQVCAPGSWRFGTRDNPALADAAVDWLRQRTRTQER
jgi:alpha/beta superfamily hydrolase